MPGGSRTPAQRMRAPRARRRHHSRYDPRTPPRSPIPATSSIRSHQEIHESLCENRRPFRFALPNDQHVPTKLMQRRYLPMITGDVLLEFLIPEGSAGLRSGRPTTALVPVPETAVNEDRLSAGGETDVGGAGKISPMESIAVSETVKQFPNGHFRLGVLRTDTRHEGAAFRRRLHLGRRLPPRSEGHSRQ